MKVLVTGASGQLGEELKAFLPPEDSLFLNHSQLDITDTASMESVFEAVHPEVVINCAAYTAVDKAESDFARCFAVNSRGVENLARMSQVYDFRILHISTDYVFDGCKSTAYSESDSAGPLSVYGSSKYEAEKLLEQHAPLSIIIRTGWLYSAWGHNFVKSILKKAFAGERMRIVDDQIGTPTSARDLARAISQIVFSTNWYPGVYNYSNEGVASWYDFGMAVCDCAGVDVEIEPIKTSDYSAPALRPHFSVLDKTKIKDTYNIRIPYWRDSLSRCVAEILNNRK